MKKYLRIAVNLLVLLALSFVNVSSALASGAGGPAPAVALAMRADSNGMQTTVQGFIQNGSSYLAIMTRTAHIAPVGFRKFQIMQALFSSSPGATQVASGNGSGSTVALTLSFTTGYIAAGQTITDSTNPGAIAANTTVTSISSSAVVTASASLASVTSGDTLVFSNNGVANSIADQLFQGQQAHMYFQFGIEPNCNVNQTTGLASRPAAMFGANNYYEYNYATYSGNGYLLSDLSDAGTYITPGSTYCVWETVQLPSLSNYAVPYVMNGSNYINRGMASQASTTSQIVALGGGSDAALTQTSITPTGTSESGFSNVITPSAVLMQTLSTTPGICGDGDSINQGVGTGVYLQWTTSFPVSVGSIQSAGGNLYQATTAGVTASSGSGPTGTGTNITDGTVVWNYYPITDNIHGDAMGNAMYNMGYLARYVHEYQHLPYFLFARGSDGFKYRYNKSTNLSPNWQYRAAMMAASGCTRLISENLHNDNLAIQPPAWAGTTVYGKGAPVTNGGSYFVTFTGGTSASSGGPSCSTGTCTDGTVTWTYVGNSYSTSGIAATMLSYYTQVRTLMGANFKIWQTTLTPDAQMLTTSTTPSVPGWATSTVYAAGAKIFVNKAQYYTVAGGTSASSGIGPSGTGTVTDGTVTWVYAGGFTSTQVQAANTGWGNSSSSRGILNNTWVRGLPAIFGLAGYLDASTAVEAGYVQGNPATETGEWKTLGTQYDCVVDGTHMIDACMAQAAANMFATDASGNPVQYPFQ